MTSNALKGMGACIYRTPNTMANKIIHHNNFSADDVTFSELRKNKMGGKVVYLSGPTKKKLMVQLPKMRAPFGLSEFTDQNSGKSSYSVDLSLDGQEGVMNTFKALDDAVIKMVAKNSQAWLGKKHSDAVVRDALYKPMVKPPSDPKYSPTMKLKLLTGSDGNFIPEAYNSKRELVPFSSLEKGQTVMAIVNINQVWIIDNKCGVSIRLEQAKLQPTEKLKGFAFIDEDGDDGEEEEEEEEEYDEDMVDDN